MIKNFILDFKKIDSKILNVMNYGFIVSLLISLISCFILSLYSTYPISHIAYLCGLSLFRLSITSFSVFLVCGIAVDKINEKT